MATRDNLEWSVRVSVSASVVADVRRTYITPDPYLIASCARHYLQLRTSSLLFLRRDRTLGDSSWRTRTKAAYGSVLGPV